LFPPSPGQAIPGVADLTPPPGSTAESRLRAVVVPADTSAVAGQVYLSDPIRFEHLVAG
jgi:hypothetical protein